MIKINWDMPESCSQCAAYEPMEYTKYQEPDEGICHISKRFMMGHKVTQGRPSWCPIRPEENAPEAEARCYLAAPAGFKRL